MINLATTVTLRNLYSEVETDDTRVLGSLYNRLACEDPNKNFAPAYKSGMWDGYHRFWNAKTKVFPTGLLNIAFKAIKQYDEDIDIIDERDYEDSNVKISPSIDLLHEELGTITLRPYQQEAVELAIKKSRGVINIATNGGKTEVACGIIQQLLPTLPKGQSIVFLTGSKEIFKQSHKRISERLGMEVGKVGDGKWDIKPVTVAMIPSLSRYLKVKPTKKADPKKYKETRDKVMGFLHSCHGFIADEVHHASSDSWYKLLMAMEQAHYRIGLTGTVAQDTTLSYMRLVGSTGRILIKISNDFLIKEGHSAKPVIHLHSHPAKQFYSPYDFARKEGIIDCIERNKKIVRLALDKTKDNQQSLIIVSETAHGNILEEVMQILSPKYDLYKDEVAFIHGDSPKSLRNNCLDKFAEGHIRILIATSIMDEGVDISGINCVFLAAGGKSTRQVLQRIGRGLRKKSDGSGVEVHDFIDDHNEYLMNHTEARIEVYKREKFDIVKH